MSIFESQVLLWFFFLALSAIWFAPPEQQRQEAQVELGVEKAAQG